MGILEMDRCQRALMFADKKLGSEKYMNFKTSQHRGEWNLASVKWADVASDAEKYEVIHLVEQLRRSSGS